MDPHLGLLNPCHKRDVTISYFSTVELDDLGRDPCDVVGDWHMSTFHHESDNEVGKYDEATTEVTQKQLNRIKNFASYKVAPDEQARFRQWVPTRREINHRFGGEVRTTSFARVFQEREVHEQPLRTISWLLHDTDRRRCVAAQTCDIQRGLGERILSR